MSNTVKMEINYEDQCLPYQAEVAPKNETTPELSFATSTTAPVEKNKEKRLQEKQEKKHAEGKKTCKEKKLALQQEILSTEVIRLRWKDLNTVPIPEGEVQEPSKCSQRKQHKGCYMGASVNGKLKFNCGMGKKSLWLSHQLTDSRVMFSPLSAPRRYLRVCPDGSVNLSNGGVGPRTRWTQTRGDETGKTTIVSSFNNLQLAGVSIGKKAKKNKECKEKQGKKKVIARCFDFSTTTSAPENVVASTFFTEYVDITQLLVKVMVNVAKKRQGHRRMAKEGRKHWKHGGEHPQHPHHHHHGMWHGRGGRGRCHKQEEATSCANEVKDAPVTSAQVPSSFVPRGGRRMGHHRGMRFC